MKKCMTRKDTGPVLRQDFALTDEQCCAGNWEISKDLKG